MNETTEQLVQQVKPILKDIGDYLDNEQQQQLLMWVIGNIEDNIKRDADWQIHKLTQALKEDN
mgnify:CR=1 FL=1